MAFEADKLNPIGRNSGSGNIIWTYISLVDALATIKAASYFIANTTSLALKDIIFAEGTDGCIMLCISAIDGGGGVTAPPLDVAAVDVSTTTLPNIGEGTQNNVQEALEDAYNAINDKIETNVNVGSGASFFQGFDTTDPANKISEFRRAQGSSTIGVGEVGESIQFNATNALLRQVQSFGGGQSIVRSVNNAGNAELRSLVSTDGTLIFGTASGGTEVNIRVAEPLDVSPATISSGAGSPEGSVSAPPGSLYLRTSPPDAQSIGYLKLSGTGNTGWQTIDT